MVSQGRKILGTRRPGAALKLYLKSITCFFNIPASSGAKVMSVSKLAFISLSGFIGSGIFFSGGLLACCYLVSAQFHDDCCRNESLGLE